jgi:peptidoglycan hydrolase-like protein with peptidoglycan-binding domain
LALTQRGLFAFSFDGEFGPQTRRSLKRFQEKEGLEPTGEVDDATLARLGLNAAMPVK